MNKQCLKKQRNYIKKKEIYIFFVEHEIHNVQWNFFLNLFCRTHPAYKNKYALEIKFS